MNLSFYTYIVSIVNEIKFNLLTTSKQFDRLYNDNNLLIVCLDRLYHDNNLLIVCRQIYHDNNLLIVCRQIYRRIQQFDRLYNDNNL
jgi:hypothetical protein